jgi:predicted secreted protein
MAERLGHHYRLYVDNGSGTYTEVAGQTDCTINRPQELIDVTAKSDALKLRVPGRPDLTVNLSGNVRLPDTNGLSRLYSVMLAQTAVNGQVRHTPFGAGDLTLAGPFYVSNSDRGMTDQQAATYSFQLTAAGAMTTDTLGA